MSQRNGAHNTDHFTTVDDLIRDRAATIPDTPLITYPNSRTRCADWVEYTARDLDAYADEAAKELSRLGLNPKHRKSTKSEVVALLGPSDLDYAISMLALTRMGFGVLFLSTRLAVEAYASLLDKTDCTRMLTTPKFVDTVKAIREGRDLETWDIVEKSIYSRESTGKQFQKQTEIQDQANAVAFIVHSSGSTGLPKPIFQSHRACLGNYALGSGMRAFVTLPLFHNSGLANTFRSIVAGKCMALYNASIPMTSASLVEGLDHIKPETFHCVPYVLKILSETPEGLAALARCKMVVYAGAGCPDDLGDLLVEKGVNLVSHYGQTEMGQLMMSTRPPGDKAWNYVRPLPNTRQFIHMDPLGDGQYECVVLDGLETKVMSNSDSPPNSYRTRDIFVKHPTIPDAWKPVGRLDDRLTLVNGEKVLPIPMEGTISQSELVHQCLIFGVGRAFPGLLVVKSDKVPSWWTRERYLDAIWPSVQLANHNAEKFAQIDRDMVEVLEADADYPRTDKGTIIRAASYKRFADLIDALYTRFEGGSLDPAGKNGTRQKTDVQGYKSYLTALFRERMGFKTLQLDTDFFSAGIDSLQAIMARSHMMRQLDLGGAVLGQNIVFEHPTINQLAEHLFVASRATRHTSPTTAPDDLSTVMYDLVAKYGNFDPFLPGTKTPQADTILLTGATGSLGAHILAQLLPFPHVRHVYCLVRAPDAAAATARVFSSLSDRGLGDCITPALSSKVIALPSDLSRPDLRLAPAVLSGLRSTLTGVIHSAWAVNFNLGVSSFAATHIAGVQNLLKLALSVPFRQPARFAFISSVSAASGTPLPARIAERYVADPRHAQGIGYAQSKCVAEHVVRRAAEGGGVAFRVLRTGQVVGDSRQGRWNATEAIPLMLRAAETMGALPRLDERPSWIPVDVCARAVVELSGVERPFGRAAEGAEDGAHVVYHVLNPRTFSWADELLPALRRPDCGLKFEEVGQREWVARLRAAAEADEAVGKHPTVKLLDFFAGKYDNDKPGRSGLVFETEKTGGRSRAIRQGFDVIGSGLMGKCVGSWRSNDWK
ncbi:putative NRPS-like protein biosynthetic cluster [Pyricularia oryzae]|nr:putative NRPS-like protein biosynthetic cluster [Pyricularia oryzae]KAI6590470.1 putative NRPS-like protein biosynthetic cluster [Pyricularia oryzae]